MLGFMEDIQSVRVEIAEDGRRIAGIYLNGKKVEEKYLDLDGIKFGFRLNENMFIEVECECISKIAARSTKRDDQKLSMKNRMKLAILKRQIGQFRKKASH